MEYLVKDLMMSSSDFKDDFEDNESVQCVDLIDGDHFRMKFRKVKPESQEEKQRGGFGLVQQQLLCTKQKSSKQTG